MSQVPAYLARPWDVSVAKRTHEYIYDDSTVWLKVEGQMFKVSRRKLTTVSAVFSNLFCLPKTDEEPIKLNHTVEDFKAFLWYLESNHFEFADWMKCSTVPERFARVLSIASMAHFYLCSEISAWATVQLKELLPSCGLIDIGTLKRRHAFSSRASDQEPTFFDQVQSYWCNTIRSSTDPIHWLVASQDLHDQHLQSFAYLQILKLQHATIQSDKRLSVLDRMRLHTGAFNLIIHDGTGTESNYRHARSSGGVSDPQGILSHRTSFRIEVLSEVYATDPARYSITRTQRANLLARYGVKSLWEIFNRSPMGFELSKIAIPSS
ncbi:hypothetical protein BKA62DRAFT_756996 [Auriculariales sp. MPI-PUGE-AT-0066]|nr:hypothetical protein BKA62DRAFT_756996 [Auriculariales sp. MPI-PUGE-AT-0066]